MNIIEDTIKTELLFLDNLVRFFGELQIDRDCGEVDENQMRIEHLLGSDFSAFLLQ